MRLSRGNAVTSHIIIASIIIFRLEDSGLKKQLSKGVIYLEIQDYEMQAGKNTKHGPVVVSNRREMLNATSANRKDRKNNIVQVERVREHVVDG
jgi:hypothetical protein